MLYKIVNGSVSYGADTILENINFEIKEKEKIAVVGRNGCGKTTLLKAILGREPLEEGTADIPFSVIRASNIRIGYLEQTTFPDNEITLLDEILKVFRPITDLEKKAEELLKKIEENPNEENIAKYSALNDKFERLGGYTYKKEYLTAIKEFGFSQEDQTKRLSEFSGGQLTKIAFIKLLLSKPDILLLDEPTNHLDITTVEWLESYLKSYPSAVVIVSHDRMFLDKTVGTVYEIEYGETTKYNGNYSFFEKQKKENYLKKLKDYEIQQAEIQRLMKLVERFRYKATKAKMVQSKLKQIEHMKKADLPNRYDLKAFHSSFQPENIISKTALKTYELKIGYDRILADISLELPRGKKLGIIGKNGIGKSTFIKTLVGKIPSLGGRFEFASGTKIGYFDQHMAQFRSEKTVLDEFHDEFPSLSETEVRSSLGAFLFSGEAVFKTVSSLSGGEKVRLALCRILKRKPNLLLLDEPTNHMDIIGKETLENMLQAFSGTIIFVSHDRYFINKIADNLLVFDDSGATFYPFGFSEFEEQRAIKKEPETEKEYKRDKNDHNDSQRDKKPERKTFTTPLKEKTKKEKKAAKLEEKIQIYEKEISDTEKELEKPEIFSDYSKITEIQARLDELKTLRDDAFSEWATISEELEKMEI